MFCGGVSTNLLSNCSKELLLLLRDIVRHVDRALDISPVAEQRQRNASRANGAFEQTSWILLAPTRSQELLHHSER